MANRLRIKSNFLRVICCPMFKPKDLEDIDHLETLWQYLAYWTPRDRV